MTLFYVPATGGFVSSEISSTIPDGAVEITADQHATLVSAINSDHNASIEIVAGVPTVTIAPVPIAVMKANKASDLSIACAAAIMGGFVSDALGAPHGYPSKPTDQTNLMGSVVASMIPGNGEGWSTLFWCSDEQGEWSFRDHTAEQIQRVGQDGKSHMVACQTTRSTLLATLEGATSEAEVASVVWPA